MPLPSSTTWNRNSFNQPINKVKDTTQPDSSLVPWLKERSNLNNCNWGCWPVECKVGSLIRTSTSMTTKDSGLFLEPNVSKHWIEFVQKTRHNMSTWRGVHSYVHTTCIFVTVFIDFRKGREDFFQNKRLKHLGMRGTKPCGRAVKINNLMKDLYYLD